MDIARIRHSPGFATLEIALGFIVGKDGIGRQRSSNLRKAVRKDRWQGFSTMNADAPTSSFPRAAAPRDTTASLCTPRRAPYQRQRAFPPAMPRDDRAHCWRNSTPSSWNSSTQAHWPGTDSPVLRARCPSSVVERDASACGSRSSRMRAVSLSSVDRANRGTEDLRRSIGASQRPCADAAACASAASCTRTASPEHRDNNDRRAPLGCFRHTGATQPQVRDLG